MKDFWSFTRRQGECLIWTGKTNPDPIYGVYSALGGRVIAHRASYELTIGQIPKYVHIGQTCGNRLCVEPKHLYIKNDIKQKLEANIEKRECWNWIGIKPKRIEVDGKTKILERVIYEIYVGEIGNKIIKSCCLNPYHMKLIDFSKMNIEKARKMRGLADKLSVESLSEMFQVSRQTVHSILNNLTWKENDNEVMAFLDNRI